MRSRDVGCCKTWEGSYHNPTSPTILYRNNKGSLGSQACYFLESFTGLHLVQIRKQGPTAFFKLSLREPTWLNAVSRNPKAAAAVAAAISEPSAPGQA